MITKKLSKAPSPIGRRERRSIETREKILRAAINLFAKRGFNATTIDAIAESANIGKGTFFNYFDNKESLLLYYQQKQLGRVGAFVTESANSDEPLLPRIYGLAAVLATEYQKSPALFRSIAVALSSNDAIRARLAEGHAHSREMMAKIIKKRQRSGEIRSDISAEKIAHSLQRMLLGTMLIWSTDPVKTLKEELRDAVKIFANGIQAEGKENV